MAQIKKINKIRMAYMKEQKFQSIKMVKAYDNNEKAFTAFVLCNEQQSNQIEQAKASGKVINLTSLNIIYQMLGHDVDEKIQEDIKQYCKMLTGELNESEHLS